MRGVEGSAPRVVISGPDPEDLAAALAVDGDRSAVVVDGDPAAAAIAVRLVDGDPDERERRALRQLMKGPTPVVVVRRGGSARIPHVLADDVVDLEVEGIRRGCGSDRPGCRCGRPGARCAATGPACPGGCAAGCAHGVCECCTRRFLARRSPAPPAHARAGSDAPAARSRPGRCPPPRPAGASPGSRPVSRCRARHGCRRPRGCSTPTGWWADRPGGDRLRRHSSTRDGSSAHLTRDVVRTGS